ncbi:hypothetical protein M5K25_009097 [Dendrobium thyrsiflorum]|uniref:Uncharacterized protein n=1 Tax=Dendrobium thyrsiflorum TaxID=117978 RepID=A0ABD0V447_DENTH
MISLNQRKIDVGKGGSADIWLLGLAIRLPNFLLAGAVQFLLPGTLQFLPASLFGSYPWLFGSCGCLVPVPIPGFWISLAVRFWAAVPWLVSWVFFPVLGCCELKYSFGLLANSSISYQIGIRASSGTSGGLFSRSSCSCFLIQKAGNC